MREVLPIQNRDCRQIVGLVESGFGADTLPGVGAPEAQANHPKRLTLLSLLPTGSQLTPYPPSKSLIVISTPDGVRLVKELIHAVDTRLNSILIRVAQVLVPPEAQDSPGGGAQETQRSGGTITLHARRPEGSITIAHTSGGLNGLIVALDQEWKIRILAETRLILPDGVQGVAGDIPLPPASAPPGASPGAEGPGPPGRATSSGGFLINVLARLNPAGTIALYVDLKDAPSNSWDGQPDHRSYLGARPFHVSIPGIRFESGETLIVEPGMTAPEKVAPGVPPALNTGKEKASAIPPRILYLISASLLDKHGQLVVGGPEAIKKALLHEGKE